MLIPGIDVSQAYATGVADTVATVVPGIKSGDNLLAVISFGAAGITPVGQDKTDFTVAAGTITAGTLDLSGLRLLVLWTTVAAS